MLKRNNFVKFIFSLLLLVSIFAFSFSACNNVVEASTVESKPSDNRYEYIYFTPLEDIDVGAFSITFQSFISQARIDIEWNALNSIDIESESYGIDNEGDTLDITNPIEYLADTEYCIKIKNENYFGINDVSGMWYALGITHCYFNYFRFTGDFNVSFLDSSCVEASFLECLTYGDDYYCTTINEDFFYQCAFEEIYLPLYLDEIYCPFSGCDNLTDIYFGTLPYMIQGVAIFCYELENYWIKDSNDEFYSTQLLVDDTTLCSMIGGSIPSNVVYIDSYCFSSFDGDTLIIPSSVSNIYVNAFSGCMVDDLIFTCQLPPKVSLPQPFDEINRIIIPYGSYDSYISQQFFSDSLIVFEAEKPLWSASLITSIISILMGGISSLSYGIGSGLTDLVSSIFVSSNGGLSLFGGVIIVFAGLSLAIGLCRLIISFITSLGGDD